MTFDRNDIQFDFRFIDLTIQHSATEIQSNPISGTNGRWKSKAYIEPTAIDSSTIPRTFSSFSFIYWVETDKSRKSFYNPKMFTKPSMS